MPNQGVGNVVTLSTAGESLETLPYHIELWHGDEGAVERVLGDALSAALAQAIYQEALREYPGRIITLRYGQRIIAHSTRRPGDG